MAIQFSPAAGDEMAEFEALLAESGRSSRAHYKPGDKVRGKVTFIGEKTATLDLNDGQEGLLDLSGMRGKDGELLFKLGDFVDAYVLRIRDRVVEVARQISKSSINMDVLHEAAASHVPVDGVVTATNKGGYVVDLGGGAQGFCPHAMIDIRRVEDGNAFVGQKLRFRVMEVRNNKDVLVSRRAYLEEEQQRKAEETRRLLKPGARLEGIVVNVRDFGAFVDLGGVEGMIPASELAYGKVKVQEVVQVGEKVSVEVMRIEPGVDGKGRPQERISLSMRALAQDPFELLAALLQPGVVLEGRVRRVEPFGAFVEIVPGVEGLIHVSAFGKRVNKPGDVVLPEQKALVRVLAVDPAARRLSLAYVAADQLEKILDPAAAVPEAAGGAKVVGVALPQENRGAGEGLASAPSNARPERARVPSIGELLSVTVDKHESFGIYVTWGVPGALGRGLLPISEMALAKGGDPRRSLPVGSNLDAVVIDARPDGRVRLSQIAAAQAREQAQAANWLSEQTTRSSSAGVGSFGEALMASLGKGKR